MKNIETKTEEPWLKRAFKKEWPTMLNHLSSCGVSIGASTGFSYFAPQYFESDATISGIATALDSGGYWASFISQLLWRDRKKLRDKNNKLDSKRIVKKIGEYVSMASIIELIYVGGRFFGQYYLQKKGWNPAEASFAIQSAATGFFTLAWPPLRYAMRQWSEKTDEEKGLSENQ